MIRTDKAFITKFFALTIALIIMTAWACGGTRELPSPITLYNSNLVKTSKIAPNDTLYVKVSSLKPGSQYKVECLDPEGKLISQITTTANAGGFIPPSPLWYEVGFKKDSVTGKPKLEAASTLELRAFNVRVTSVSDNGKSTDFKLPFFIVYNTNIARPQPIVMAGTGTGATFQVENAFRATNNVSVQVANLTALPIGQATARVYVVPFKGANMVDGEAIEVSKAVATFDATLTQLQVGVNVWTNIPSSAEGKAFSVIVDMNNNGNFDILLAGTKDYYLDGIDGNGVPGFIVEKPTVAAPAGPKFLRANIASGGMFTWDSGAGAYDFDYRDNATFKADGSGTAWAYGNWNSLTGASEFGGYGVKAIWNPYIRYTGDPEPTSNTASLYYGTIVDVYVVPSTFVLTASTPLTGTDVSGGFKTLPVQYGCQNGLHQQTIWSPPMTAGDYFVIVDVDRNGVLSDGDIVDNISSLGALGFRVVP